MDVGGVPDLPLLATPVWEALGLEVPASSREARAGSA
jgi:hypothetical protein